MKRLKQLISEVKGEKAHREAVAKGLKYKGFGYWVDPATNQVAFKTEDDTLVPVDPDVEADKAGPGGGDPAMPGGGPEAVGDMGSGAQMMQSRKMMGLPDVQPGSVVKGVTNPGEEQVPTTLEWEPGPDGSTCVDSDEPAAIVPEDSFVSRTNHMKWGAGPDGTNYANIDYADMLKDLKSPNLDTFMNRMKMEQAMPHPIRKDEDV